MPSDPLELAQAEVAKLRKSEAYYRVLAEAAQDHIFVIDRDDRVQYVNQAAARRFRTTPDKVIGRGRAEISPPDMAWLLPSRVLKRSYGRGAVKGRIRHLFCPATRLLRDGTVDV
jgi:PAS domain S-box-containing protein